MWPILPCLPCRELSKEPHLASSPRDEALVQLLLGRWSDPVSGLDLAKTYEYEVLLSFPSPTQPNHVEVGKSWPSRKCLVWQGQLLGPLLTLLPSAVGSSGDILHSFYPGEKNLTGEQVGPDVVQPYAAYAPPGTPKVSMEPPLL